MRRYACQVSFRLDTVRRYPSFSLSLSLSSPVPHVRVKEEERHTHALTHYPVSLSVASRFTRWFFAEVRGPTEISLSVTAERSRRVGYCPPSLPLYHHACARLGNDAEKLDRDEEV